MIFYLKTILASPSSWVILISSIGTEYDVCKIQIFRIHCLSLQGHDTRKILPVRCPLTAVPYLQENITDMMNSVENWHPALARCLLEQVQGYACRSVNPNTHQRISRCCAHMYKVRTERDTLSK
jgi:hypothetical protein